MKPVAPRRLGSLIAVAIAFAGCGDSGNSDRQRDTDAGYESDWGSAAGGAKPPPVEYEAAAERAVRRYYADVDHKRFEAAWSRLGTNVQTALGGFDEWVSGQERTLSVKPVSVIADATKKTAQVSVELKTVDEDSCGERVKQTFEGSWDLQRIAGAWTATHMSMRRTAGQAPALTNATCADPEDELANEVYCTEDVDIPAVHIPGDRSLGIPPETIPAETIPGECFDLSEGYSVLADNYESIDPDYSPQLTSRYRSRLDPRSYRTPDYTAPGYGGYNAAGYPKNQYVSPYVRSDGTYVNGYWRNSPTDGYATCRVIDC